MVNNGKHSRVIIFTRGKPNKVVRALTIDRKECNRNNLVLFMFYLYSIELPRTFFSHTTLISIDSIELTKMSQHRCRDTDVAIAGLKIDFGTWGILSSRASRKREKRDLARTNEISHSSPREIFRLFAFQKPPFTFFITHTRVTHTLVTLLNQRVHNSRYGAVRWKRRSRVRIFSKNLQSRCNGSGSVRRISRYLR